MKPLFHPIKLTGALIFAFVSFSSSPVLSEKDKDDPGGPDPGKPTRQGTTVRFQKAQGGKDPDDPGGPNPGRPTQQGTTVNRGNCGTGEDEDVIVMALVPKANIDGGTDRERPTFWFYIDYASNPPKSVHKARLKILNDDDSDFFEKEITLPKTSGYFSITAPSINNRQVLEKNKDYNLHFSLICDGRNADSNKTIENPLRRIDSRNSFESKANLSLYDTVYDRVDNIMQRQCKAPTNSATNELPLLLEELNLASQIKPSDRPIDCSFY